MIECEKFKSGLKNIKKGEIRIWKDIWRTDKIETNRINVLCDKENIVEITISEWDMLQINNKQIKDSLKSKSLSNLKILDEVTERSEIQYKQKFIIWGSYRFVFSFFIPLNFPIIDNRLVFSQIKQVSCESVSQNPLLAQRFKNGKYMISFNNNGDIDWKVWNKIVYKIDADQILGKRVDVEYEIKFSESNDWFIKIKHNWSLMREYNWRVSSSSQKYPIWKYYENKFYFKLWLYRDNYHSRLKHFELEKNHNKIKSIKKAIFQQDRWELMTIFFKLYSIE